MSSTSASSSVSVRCLLHPLQRRPPTIGNIVGGVYWQPPFNLMEGHFEQVMIVNAEHLKRVPGHKTDQKDAEWIAELLQVGLLKPSFIPKRSQRELRQLTRLRTTLTQERTRLINRLQNV